MLGVLAFLFGIMGSALSVMGTRRAGTWLSCGFAWADGWMELMGHVEHLDCLIQEFRAWHLS